MPVRYSVRYDERCDCNIVEFEIVGGVLDTSELVEAVESAPGVDTTKGVCLSGRGPVWLYCALAHKYHPTAWVGTFEPRKNACVVVESHIPEKKLGELIPVEK